jgi:hypothetical protein
VVFRNIFIIIHSIFESKFKPNISLKMKTKKYDILVIILTLISISLITLSFTAQNIFTAKTFSDLMNPFIALAGVFITFLAFYMQLKANKIQLDVFNSNQIEQNRLLKEQMFFRLIDNLNQRIINFSHTETQDTNNQEYRNDFISYKALDNIIKRFFRTMDFKCIGLGRQLLASIPEQLGTIHYSKILQISNLNNFPSIEDVEELKNEIISRKTFNERWEYIKFYVGSTDTKNKKQNDVLKSIGHVQFYKVDFIEKESLYISTYDEIYQEYGGFMDGYLKNFTYLVNFISKSKDNEFFIDYLKSNISTQELILIFYFCASRKSNYEFRKQIKEMSLFDNLHIARDRFIDLPSEEELNKEVESILKPSANR